MRICLRIALKLAIALSLPCVSYGQTEGTFTISNSVLLFETTETSMSGQPHEDLLVVSTTDTVVVRSPVGFFGQDYNTVFPALAPGADRVAWGLSTHDESRKVRLKAVLGLYSLVDKTWKTYGDFCAGGVGSVAFAPDGTRVAFASQSKDSPGDGYCFNNPIMLQILDTATGKLTPISYPGRAIENARLSWSPDGKYLVGQFCCSASSTYQIVVIDLAGGGGTVIAEGTDPAWSPKGDWISFEDQKKKKCMLIHPDGTGMKPVEDLKGYWLFLKGAVWSPDGDKLLFNEEEVDSAGNVSILDLSNGDLTRRSKNTLFVLGWARQPPN